MAEPTTDSESRKGSRTRQTEGNAAGDTGETPPTYVVVCCSIGSRSRGRLGWAGLVILIINITNSAGVGIVQSTSDYLLINSPRLLFVAPPPTQPYPTPTSHLALQPPPPKRVPASVSASVNVLCHPLRYKNIVSTLIDSFSTSELPTPV